MKAMIDKDMCAGHSQCVDTCPQVFEMDGDKAKVKMDMVPSDQEQACREAADGCPTGAISIEG